MKTDPGETRQQIDKRGTIFINPLKYLELIIFKNNKHHQQTTKKYYTHLKTAFKISVACHK